MHAHHPCSFLSRLLARIPIPHFLLFALEELQVSIRGCYLLLLFLPAVCTAHFAFWAGGEQRKRWMKLMIWTLQLVSLCVLCVLCVLRAFTFWVKGEQRKGGMELS
jgi:hypothetical protein